MLYKQFITTPQNLSDRDALQEKLTKIAQACLKVAPSCREKKWFKDYNNHIRNFENSERPVISLKPMNVTRKHHNSKSKIHPSF